MLQAIDREGNTYLLEVNPRGGELREIKSKSKKGELFCPACHAPLSVRTRDNEFFYFVHKSGQVCSNLDWQKETEEREKGKLLLKKWLEQQYPESLVKLEYKRNAEERQTDVMLVHSEEEYVAFQFLCNNPSEELWKTWHEYYLQKGMQVVWVVGKELDENDEVLRKELECLSGAWRGIYDRTGSLVCLDVEQETMCLLYKCEKERYQTIWEMPIYRTSIWSAFWKRGHVLTAQLQKRLGFYAQRRTGTHEEEKFGIVERQFRIKMIREELQNLRSILRIGEYQLFCKLCNKHKFTIWNLPGCFYVKTRYGDSIDTPPHVWQLWLYDEFFANRKKEVAWGVLFRKFRSMVRLGTFHVTATNTTNGYPAALREYLEILVRIGMIRKRESSDYEVYETNVAVVPKYEEKDVNGLICLALEDPNSCEEIEVVNQAYKRFLEDLRLHKQSSVLEGKKKSEEKEVKPFISKRRPIVEKLDRSLPKQPISSKQSERKEKTPKLENLSSFDRLVLRVYDVAVLHPQHIQTKELLWFLRFAQGDRKHAEANEKRVRQIKRTLEGKLEVTI